MKKYLIIVCLTLITIAGFYTGNSFEAMCLWIGYTIWHLYTEPDTCIYIVQSRDNGPISAHEDENDAHKRVQEQIKQEEMSGGRPSVYVKQLKVEPKKSVITIE